MPFARHLVRHTPEPRPEPLGARMGHHRNTTAATTSPAGHLIPTQAKEMH